MGTLWGVAGRGDGSIGENNIPRVNARLMSKQCSSCQFWLAKAALPLQDAHGEFHLLVTAFPMEQLLYHSNVKETHLVGHLVKSS